MGRKRKGRKPLNLNSNVGNSRAGKKRKKKKDDDSESDTIVDTSNVPTTVNKYVSSKYKIKEKADINIILAQDEADAFKAKVFCWNTITAGSTSLLCRKLCSVCGYEGKYRCLKCYEHKPTPFIKYYCSMQCKKQHNELNCCR